MRKTYHNRKITKWIIFLSKFDVTFISQKSIKGQVIIYQLAEAHLKDTLLLNITFPNEDIFKVDEEEVFVDISEDYDMNMYFNQSRCEERVGGGIVFFTPQGFPIPYYMKL